MRIVCSSVQQRMERATTKENPQKKIMPTGKTYMSVSTAAWIKCTPFYSWSLTTTDRGLSQISKEEAARLRISTTPIPGHEDLYIIQLDVFHQLHCLNSIRMAMWPDHFNLTFYLGPSDEARRSHLGKYTPVLSSY